MMATMQPVEVEITVNSDAFRAGLASILEAFEAFVAAVDALPPLSINVGLPSEAES